MGLDGVRQAARWDRRLRFTALLHHIMPALLKASFCALQHNAAAGADGVTWREYEGSLHQRVPGLHRKIHTGAYRAQPPRRVFIPKADDLQRPLGIASLEDKIVQQAVVTVLSAVYETGFLGFSYGFGRGRGQHEALDALVVGIKSRKVNSILGVDMRSFFDGIDHGWMLRFLEHRIADRRILSLVRKWLQAGVIEDGLRVAAERRTPQNAVISLLLANICLHYVLDLWAHHWRKQHATGGDVIVVRHADDNVLGFQREKAARQFLYDLQGRLAKFGLTLHLDKTRLIEFGRFAVENRRKRGQGHPETFDFLGLTHCCGTNRQRQFQVVRLTVKKRMWATLTAIRATPMRRHEPIAELGEWLRRVVQGCFNCCGVPSNFGRLEGFRSEGCRGWRHALRRRSLRRRLSWERFNRLVRRYVPHSQKLRPYLEERFHASRP